MLAVRALLKLYVYRIPHLVPWDRMNMGMAHGLAGRFTDVRSKIEPRWRFLNPKLLLHDAIRRGPHLSQLRLG